MLRTANSTCSNYSERNLDCQLRYIVFSLEQIGTPDGYRMRLQGMQSLPLVISVAVRMSGSNIRKKAGKGLNPAGMVFNAIRERR